MMNKKTALIASGICVTGLLTLPVLTYQLIPNTVIQQAVTYLTATKGIKITAENLTKTFPIGIKAHKLSLGNTQATWIVLNKAKLTLQLLPLFVGRIAVSFQGAVTSNSTLDADLALWPKMQGTAHADNLALETISLLQSADGGSMRGTAKVEITLQTTQKVGTTGQVKLLVNNLHANGLKISAMPLPDLSCPQIRGMATIQGTQLRINNLAFAGKGIYARLQGMVQMDPNLPLNLNLELMPSAELLEQQKSLFLVMFPYQVSSGSYQIPIGGTLSNPQLSRK